MKQELARFGGGLAETALNPYAMLVVLIACLLILLLPRKYVVIPLLIPSFLLPLGQVIVVGSLHFMMFRILIIVALIRLMWRELPSLGHQFRMNAIDKAFVLWIFSSVVAFTLLWGEWGAFVQRMGTLLNALGIYFVLRFVCRDLKDVDRTTKVFAVVCAVAAACMLYERSTGRNLFHVFGGVPEFTGIREGQLRAQGPFAHPILAGTFGATLVPLFIGLWWQNTKSRTLAVAGTVSATVIAITAASSTALVAYAAGVGALLFWPLRKWMRWFRWGVVVTLIGLHIVMKAPVWSLIGRFDVVGGSSGYHRYFLVDQFIRRFGEWWLVGIKSTNGWGWDMWDTSNQYVETGVTGGVVTLIFFFAVIVYCFKALGKARKTARGTPGAQHRLWCLGSTFFANLVGFFGITYFDQTSLYWYALIAMISAVTVATLAMSSEKAASAAVPVPDYNGLALNAQPAGTRDWPGVSAGSFTGN